MSSSGIITNIHSSPTNNYTEQQRKVDLSTISSSHQSIINRITGTVSEVHPNNPRFVKAYSSNGAMVADGKWIELTHSAQEIAERWGMIRPGFEIKITYTGPSGVGADAYVMKPVNPDKLLSIVKEKLAEQEEAEHMSEEKLAQWIESRIRKIEGIRSEL